MRIQLPWALAVLAAGLVVAAIALLAAGSSPRLPPPISTRSLAASEYVAWIVLAGVGARIVTCLPANRVGWLLLAASVLAGVQLVVYEYAVAGLFVWPVVEFLAHDLGVDTKPGWQDHVDEGRQRWHERQLSSAIRYAVRHGPRGTADRLKAEIDALTSGGSEA